jgi:hypothetical protein
MNVSIDVADLRLNLSNASFEAAMQYNLPLGSPVASSDRNVCLLVQVDYVLGYSHSYSLPLWTAFALAPVSYVIWFIIFGQVEINQNNNQLYPHNMMLLR